MHKINVADVNEKTETLFSKKRPTHACDSCMARKPCNFCICYDCLKIIEKKDKGITDSKGNRRSGSFKKKEDYL